LVEVLEVDHVEAAELLPGLGEGAVGVGDLVAADADRRGGADGFQGLTGDVRASGLHVLGVLHVRVENGLFLFGRLLLAIGFVRVDQQ